MKIDGSVDITGALVVSVDDNDRYIVVEMGNQRYRIVPVHDQIKEETWLEAQLL